MSPPATHTAVRIKISGHGAFDSLALPPQGEWHDFKTYPPTSKLETTDRWACRAPRRSSRWSCPRPSRSRRCRPFLSASLIPTRRYTAPSRSLRLALVVRPGGSAPTPTVVIANARAGRISSAASARHRAHQAALGDCGPGLPRRWYFNPGSWCFRLFPCLPGFRPPPGAGERTCSRNNPRLRRHRQVAQAVRQGLGRIAPEAPPRINPTTSSPPCSGSCRSNWASGSTCPRRRSPKPSSMSIATARVPEAALGFAARTLSNLQPGPLRADEAARNWRRSSPSLRRCWVN